jgi:hypothetical protein
MGKQPNASQKLDISQPNATGNGKTGGESEWKMGAFAVSARASAE